jgi:uroporphyrinogen III methyltransferase/synthase
MGAVVDEVPVYETRTAGEENATLLSALAERRVDMVTFTSSSTVKNFADLLPPETEKRQALLRDVAVACIGPITADTARSMGFAVTLTAEVYTIPGLVSSVTRYYANAVTDSAVPGG